MEEEIKEAVSYADSTARLENMQLSDSELLQIVEDIKNGRTEDSFLYGIVKAATEKGNELKEGRTLVKEGNHGQLRK